MINRRKALGSLAGSTLAAMAAGGQALAQGATTGRALPNILWLTSEDNNPFIGAYGDPVARTPVLDALAQRGVLYRNAYANAPVCAPSRFSILTGVHAESCGPAHHMRAVAEVSSDLRSYPEYLRSAGYYCTNNEKTDYNCDIAPERIWDASGKTAHWRDRPAGQPFMAVFNSMTTHESRLFRPTQGAVTPDEVRVPAYLPDTPAVRGDFASYYNLVSAMDAEIGQRLAELEADGLADDTIIFYYSDNGGVLPRSKRYCYDEGLRCALIVHVPPKWQHLSPVPMGTEVTTPVSFIDLAPTLLSIAGIERPQQMRGNAFLGHHVATPAGVAFGMRNRMDERYDFTRTVTDGRYRYIRNYSPNRIWGTHGAFEWMLKSYQSWDEERIAGRLNDVQARFFQTKPFEELYDRVADVDQVTNLIDDQAHAARIAQFRSQLDEHMLAIRDNGFIPEGEIGEGLRPSRDEQLYPLKDIMVLAAAAARGDQASMDLFVANLRHANPIMRYWAATGMAILKAHPEASHADLIRLAEGDPSHAVRVAAAEALSVSGAIDAGLPQLAADPALPMPPRLMALNALDALGEAARPALPALEAAAQDENPYLARAASYQVAVLNGTYTPSMVFLRGPGGA
ncbi:sulfatase-like hydrolase/transferase [Croceibacterium sp. TMG7-5b_MA50]|uniref:sulfatase-like hydrolase/transferase n=1 Tax=Croceibacterium sp. TMG7-5b_MA50 TaxID=3121290 RepID=UPI003221B830